MAWCSELLDYLALKVPPVTLSSWERCCNDGMVVAIGQSLVNVASGF